MGGGAWTTDTYTARSAAKAATGRSTFDYSDRMLRSTPRSSWKAHGTLDPQATNNNGPYAGKNTREAADSVEHPESVAIGVFFDVTGSMGSIPRVLQTKLPSLLGMLKDKGYVEHPQIMFGAIGDAHTDAVPLQVSQFESDNRMDEHLENIVLEGGGGGQMRESYELAMYMAARCTAIDCHSQRGKKGYLFLMGDELPYDVVRKEQVQKIIGDGVEADIPTEQIVAELQDKYEVFFLFVKQGGYGEQQILPTWRQLLGERALVLDDANAVCETIALTIGLLEGTTTLADGVQDLADVSGDTRAVKAAGRALATVGAGASAAAASVDGSLGALGTARGTARL